MKKIILQLVVLVSGAVVMIFELVGSRMLAPFLGTSLPVWTSLIGIVLGSLSLGYYMGGKLADRRPRRSTLSLILMAAAVLIAFTAVAKMYILGAVYFYIDDIRIGSVLASLLLFAPASVFLGMVSPYAVKLSLDDLETSGNTVGRLSATSTIGSIVGTFTAGFFLVPNFGSTTILFLLPLLLLASAVSLEPAKFFRFKKRNIAMVSLLFIFYSLNLVQAELPSIFIDIETEYNSLRIFETTDTKTGRPVRGLSTDPHGTQGAVFLDVDDDLVFDYLKFYRMAEHFVPDLEKGLFIGGGVYAFPKDFVKRHKSATLDVVEIDPGVTEVAREYFNLTDHDRINIIHEDGRTFLNRNSKTYDVIYLDAFNAHLTIPFQLTTREAVERAYDSLDEDGIVIANIISSIEGDNGKFLRAEIATFREYFKQVYVFPVNADRRADESGNIMLVALKSAEPPQFTSQDPQIDNYLQNRYQDEIPVDLPILTDEFAPVDFYTMKLIN